MRYIKIQRWPSIHHDMLTQKTKARKSGKTRWACLLLALLIGLLDLNPAHGDSPNPPQVRLLNLGLNATKDPVSANDGAYYFDLPLLKLGGPMGLDFHLSYHSGRSMAQYMWDLPGSGEWWWDPKYTCNRYEIDGEVYYQFQLEGGNIIAFKQKQDGTYRLVDPSDFGISYSSSPTVFQLQKNGDSLYLLDPRDDKVYIFEAVKSWWRIRSVVDGRGNYLLYTYAEAGSDIKPSRIEDNHGRSLDLVYEGRGIATVKGNRGRTIIFNYENNCEDNNGRTCLRSVEDAQGQIHAFEFTSVTGPDHVITEGLITAYTLPEGNVPSTQTYTAKTVYDSDEFAHACVSSQTDAYNNLTTFNWDGGTSSLTLDWPDSTSNTFTHADRYSPPRSVVDPRNNEIQFAVDDRNQITGMTDRMGDTTTVGYHAQTGKIASITNNKGAKFANSNTEQNRTFTNPVTNATVTFTCYNLTRIDYPDNTNERFTYDGKGNMLTRIDRNNNTWTYTYSDRGQVLTVTNPTGGVTTYTYNADATLASATDSDTGTTTYEYDTYKRPIKTVHPDKTFVAVTYDLNDRVTSITDERGNVYAYTYDKNGNLVTATDPADKASRTAYDLMDRVKDVTDRRGMKTQYAYNNMNQLASVTDPNGNKTQYGYDSRGWMNKVTDGAGKIWQTGYDDEGLSVSETTPLGFATTITRDKLGYVTGVTDPLSLSTIFTRDSMTRITGVTDPMNRRTTYGYDGNGLLTSVTLPVVGTARYTRNALGLLSNIKDLNGNNWPFTHTDMGSPASMSDPLGHQWRYAHDQRGRLVQTTYPDASTQGLTLDGAGNVTARTYSQGPTLNYTYDDLDRMLTAENINFAYNGTGQVTGTTNPGTTFGATHDDGGRIKTATYGNGLFTVTYTYDERNLLTRVTDSLTNTTVQFTHDDDARLTGITRSSGANTAFTLDNASRITRIQHGTLGDLQYTYNGAGEVTKLDYDLPLDPADYITAKTDIFTYDAASQVSSAGYTHDARGRMTATPTDTFTWDGASRLTATTNATLAYNGLNDLLTREVNGTTLHCYYNYALGLKPMVAEKNETTSQWQRFYVLTPRGRLLYMIDASDGNKVYFYHCDKTGNTLFLTDAAGAVTDSYAYTPYGKLLAHEGSNDQPFTFVGAWQVRREGDGGLYQMRARYYDAVTARFISREPLWPRVDKPHELNPYQYALQNPEKYIDPIGLEEVLSVWCGDSAMFMGAIRSVLYNEKSAQCMVQDWNTLSLERRLYFLRIMDTSDDFFFLRLRQIHGKNIAEQFLKRVVKLQKRNTLERRKPKRLETFGNEDTIQSNFAGTPSTVNSVNSGNTLLISEFQALFMGQREAPKKPKFEDGGITANPSYCHTIEWTVETSGNHDGIGSRYFKLK